MRKPKLPGGAIALVVVVLFLVACGGGDGQLDASQETAEAAGGLGEAAAEASGEGGDGDEGQRASGEAASGSGGPDGGQPRKPGIEITTGDSQFGEALFDGDRRAIYFFDKEDSERSECYGECAAAWPPVLTDDEPLATGDAESKLLGLTKREDGSTQVTYNGRPLYYYVDDPPGQILCHNVVEFGGLWLAVKPDGEAFG